MYRQNSSQQQPLSGSNHPSKSDQEHQQDRSRQGSSSTKKLSGPLGSRVGNDFNQPGPSNARQGDQLALSDNNCQSNPRPFNQLSQNLDAQSLSQQQQENKELIEDNKILKNGQLLNAIRKNKTSEEKLKKVQKHLDEGADINTRDANNRNNTPLHIAVLKGETEIVKLLLDRGAIIDNKNADNKTPLDIAKLPKTPNGKDNGSILQLYNQRASVEQSSGQLLVQQQPRKKRTRDNSKRNKQEKFQFLYRKRCGTSGISGQLYETKLLMLLLFRALNNKEINEFYLGTNVDGIGSFDDLIFRYNLNGQEKVIFIQAKHRDDPDKNKVTVGAVQKKDGDLSLHKYLDSYLRVKQKFNPHSEDDIFKSEYKNIDCDFVIYTPAKEDFKEDYTSKGDLLYTSEAGKTFQFEFDSSLLVKTASELRTKLLAENLAKFILSDKDNYRNMMSDELIKNYHVFLAKKVIQVYVKKETVSDIKEPGDYLIGKFLPSFFDSNENLLSILRETLYKEIVVTHRKKSTLQPEEVKSLVNEILKLPSVDAISKLIGSILTFDVENSKLKFIEQEISQEIIKLKGDLEKKEVRKEIVEEAIAAAGKEKLKSLSFKLSSAFGNLDFNVKNERRLKHLNSKFIELLKNKKVTTNNIVKIDDTMVGHEKMLNNGDMAINGGIGGLVGNLLVLDEDTRILKFNSDEESLPRNAKQLFKKLKDEISEDEINSYRFEINVTGFPKLSLVHEKYDKSLIEDFLSKLKFYTNQAKEDEVEKIMKEEIDRHYVDKKQDELLFRVKSDAIFLKVHDEIQKWWKQPKEAYYLTKSCTFFGHAKKYIIDSPLLTILNFIYINKVKKNEIEFSQDAIQTLELDKFTAGYDDRALNIITNENTLSNAKLVQYFENKNSNNHTFMDLDYVLRTGCYKKVIPEFKEARQDILIIGCNEHYADGNINVEELYRELKGIIDNKSKSSKKIILVTKRNDILAENFKKDFLGKYIEKEDKKNRLIDLTNKSQTKLLEDSQVIFQGEEVSLSILIDDNLKHLIDKEVLSKLINNEKIEIGKTLTNSKYDDVKDYYIGRKLNRFIKIKKEFSEKEKVDEKKLKEVNLFVTYNSQISGSNLLENQDVVLISNVDENFKELCDKYKEHNIHWFKKEHNEFIWQKSKGNLKKLHKCVDKGEQGTYSFEPKTIKDVDDDVVIIAAEPGMGKTTVLNHLAVRTKKSDPTLWIVRITLLNYSTELERLKERKIKFDKIEAIKFLYRTVGFQLFEKKEEAVEDNKEREQVIENILSSITVKDNKISLEGREEKIKSYSLLEIELFNNFYNQGKIALLFDGFDEISPDYKEKVVELLKLLKDAKVVRVWVTTRPYNILGRLEEELNTFSYTLKAFSPQNHKSFLEGFWKKYLELSKLDSNRFNIFTTELLKRFSQSINNQAWEYIGIPLHTYMIAKIFQSTFKEFYDSKYQHIYLYSQKLSEELNLVTLYERFIDIKFYEIRFGEKKSGMHTADPDLKGVIKKEHEQFIEDHKELAVYAILKEDELGKLLSKEEISKVHSLIESIKQGREKTGIIDGVSDGKPHFIHRTFAEYFAAELIYDKLKSTSSTRPICDFFSRRNFFASCYENVRKFFDCKLARDNELVDLSSLSNHKETIFRLLLEQDSITSLCVAVDEGLVNITNFLLKSVEDNLNKDNLDDFIEVIKENVLLCLLIESGDRQTIDNLLKCVAYVDAYRLVDIINVGCREYNIPLHLAISKDKKIVDILLKYIEDKDQIVQILNISEEYSGKTVLHLVAEGYMTEADIGIVSKYIEKLDTEQRMEVLNAPDNEDRVPAHYAAGINNFVFFDHLDSLLNLDQFRKVCNTSDIYGDTPMDIFDISSDDDDSNDLYSLRVLKIEPKYLS